ncbi:MAG: thiol peroxidase [Flavobacteriaceae bacterium]|nr:thiol peroxidase [Flavobacteriaceae bacterium]
MATVTLKGNEFNTSGELPKVGSKAPNFSLTAGDLSTKSLSDFNGSKLVLNIFPSIDTGTCAASVRQFNKEAGNLENTKVLCISRDLPFAQGRFCGAEGLDNVINLSDYKTGQFGKDYGMIFINGPLDALLSRSVIILNEEGTVIYTEQVSETVNEPNYENALAVL